MITDNTAHVYQEAVKSFARADLTDWSEAHKKLHESMFTVHHALEGHQFYFRSPPNLNCVLEYDHVAPASTQRVRKTVCLPVDDEKIRFITNALLHGSPEALGALLSYQTVPYNPNTFDDKGWWFLDILSNSSGTGTYCLSYQIRVHDYLKSLEDRIPDPL